MEGTFSYYEYYNEGSSNKQIYTKRSYVVPRFKRNDTIEVCNLTHRIQSDCQKNYTDSHKIYEKHVKFIPKYRDKGFIFVLPNKEKCTYLHKVIKLLWFVTHTLYILDAIHLLPSEIGVPTKLPPWKYLPPSIRKIQTTDYIIEPDWDSKSAD